MPNQRHTRTLDWEVVEHAENGSERAAHVTPLVAAYAELFGDSSSSETTYCDLIADLLHAWALHDGNGAASTEGAEQLVQRAVAHFREERDEEHGRYTNGLAER